jgi:hypothetical protein
MPTPDTITVTTIDPIDSVVVSPNPEVDSVSVSTIQDITNLTVGFETGITDVSIADDPETLDVNISISDMYIPVTSVNGKVGAVVIDYPDISDTPVNHVRYHHIQAEIPRIEPFGEKWAGYYIWTIHHNLNFYPSITVFDSGDNIIEAYIDYSESINTAIIVMNSAISGEAYLS